MLVYQRRMGSNRYIMGYIMGYVFSQWERNLLVNIFLGGAGCRKANPNGVLMMIEDKFNHENW
jgi:hypothetical protein